MCSTQDARLAVIAAIEDAAASARAMTAATSARAEETAMAEVTARLATVWAMVAELDPGLAARLPGYVGHQTGAERG